MAEAPDKLSDYVSKRDFTRTKEPQGGAPTRADGKLGFVVQKHDATRLHYDFRLEWEGVLLSWAVTKGPSPDPGEKRLAVRTEDHPLEYASFEGTIPKGEYGGGTVMLWDTGTWEPVEDIAKGLKAGKLKVRLHGQRMQGGWALVRMRTKGKRENWLLIKERDDLAGEDAEALTRDFMTSITTGRSMEEIAEGLEKPADRPRKKKPPKFRDVQLATLYKQAPEGDDWSHEIKFDGYRTLAALGKGGTRFYTRNGKDWTDRYGPLAEAFATLPCDAALIDGEVMAARIEGSAFSSLQRALSEGGPLVFVAFDLLSLDGKDMAKLPQEERRDELALLLAGLPKDGALRMSDHVIGHGPEVHAQACEGGAEGIISKRRDAPYRGSRTKAWRKIKCSRRQEFVIGGFSPSDKPGRPFASLLIGSNEDGKLRYRGRVGTGFDEAGFARLQKAMKPRKTSPFAEVPRDAARGAKWVTPALVAEVEFTEFTDDGYVRHGSYLGLREDKTAGDVHLETGKESDVETTVLGTKITSADRRVFPEAGCTKLDIAQHYARVGKRMMALMSHRPLSLYRCPGGLEDSCFFQKHAGTLPDAVSRVEIEESDGKTAEYLYATRPESLVAAAQMGTVEFHIWGARTDRLDRPDRLVFDLDPDEGLGWESVRDAACELRDRLQDLGLASGAMVTGGKGVHVWLPLRRIQGWETVKLFSKTFAHVMAEKAPERYTATMSKSKRKGRIFIDWLRNERGSTAVAPYSLRARKGAPVAVPVTWDELSGLAGANAFSLGDIAARLDQPCPAVALQEDLQSLNEGVIDALHRWSSEG
ncbi:DNA ligase D [Marinovum sp.]|uniref:DNA ligase D n=1 Tax=Marinovum sp. TaxID=2024839 RepID=UPI002B26AFCD|nr:DNA ligase D [Marinovum sp.]